MITDHILTYFDSLISLAMEMAPYLLLGFLIAGVLHVYVPTGLFTRWLGKRNFKSILYASLMGIPLPLCSCGVIPTGISLFKDGASKGATVSFLISTPQTGVDSIMVTYSLLGLPFAIVRPIIALITGLGGGWLVNKFEKEPVTEPVTESQQDFGKHDRSVSAIFTYAFGDFLREIADWLIIGLALAALIETLVPDEFFTSSILSNEFLSMFLVLLASTPLYVCATGSVPIAAVLLMKGLNPGAVLVFLMAGPATNVATMTVISKTLGNRTLLLYLTSLVVGSFVFGLMINHVFPTGFFVSAMSEPGHHQATWLKWTEIIAGAIFGLLLMRIYFMKLMNFFKQRSGASKSSAQELDLEVEGMTCQNCRKTVEDALLHVKGVNSSSVNLESKKAHIKGNDIKPESLKAAVEKAGYKISGDVHEAN